MSKISLVISDAGWIMERCASEIAKRIPIATITSSPDSSAELAYYLPYSAYHERVCKHEVAFFTHIEEVPSMRRKFFDVAKRVDCCVVMARRYRDRLQDEGVDNVALIKPGIDPDLFFPRVRIGVVGRTYHTGRKGEAFIEELMDESGIEWHFTGSGWPGESKSLSAKEMPDFYRSMDYILVPSLIEGGPMSLVEALACGTKVIAPDVGSVPDYPHIGYRRGDANDLRRVLRLLLEEKQRLAESVQYQTWERWASEHAEIFEQILGKSVPYITGGIEIAQREKRKYHAPSIRPKGISDGQRPSEPPDVTIVTHGNETGTRGGPSVRSMLMSSYFRKEGTRAKLTTGPTSSLSGLVHVLNIWPTDSALETLRIAKALGNPLVFSPIFLNLAELFEIGRKVPEVFEQSGSSSTELEKELFRISQEARRRRLWDPETVMEDPFPGYLDSIAEMVSLLDALISLSELERKFLAQVASLPEDTRIIRNGIEVEQYIEADSKIFTEATGLTDYILCVGRIEDRKNQLLLSHALKDVDIPLVLIGGATDARYSDLVRAFSSDFTYFLGHIPYTSPLLRSAYAGARVFALSSWAEGAPLAALEAAAAGCGLVLSNRSSEQEYFGDYASYCDPSDSFSIRDAVLEAYESPLSNSEKSAQQNFVVENYSISDHANRTNMLYEDVLRDRLKTKRKVNKPINDTVYVDITSLAHHTDSALTGITRSEMMIALKLGRQHPDRVRFVVWNSSADSYSEVSYEQLRSQNLIHLVSEQPSTYSKGDSQTEQIYERTTNLSRSVGVKDTSREAVRKRAARKLIRVVKSIGDLIISRYPLDLRPTAFATAKLYWHAFSHTSTLTKMTFTKGTNLIKRYSIHRMLENKTSPHQLKVSTQLEQSGERPDMGSTLLILGGGWNSNSRYSAFLRRVAKDRNLRLAAIIYDLIPIDYPQFVHPQTARTYLRGLGIMLDHSDHLFCISSYTADRLTELSLRAHRHLPPVTILRLGDTSGTRQTKQADPKIVDDLSDTRFALMVSTITYRKNFDLLYTVWRRMCDSNPEDVPILVVAGGIGWGQAELMSLVREDPITTDKIRFLGRVSEETLEWLYGNCLFTLYPSWAEGWGLPVAESLNHGKLCLCSSAGAIPEVAPGLTITIDPIDTREWLEKIQELIDNDAELRKWERKIRKNYRPTSWSKTSQNLWRGLWPNE